MIALDRARDAARRRAAGDSGLTLIELLVTMILLGVISSLVVTAVSQAGRIVTHTEDEDTGLQDAKVILDRVGRDIRESRGVVCDGAVSDPGCLSHLQLWVDANSNYTQEPTEVITWQLQLNPDGVHSDVFRTVGTGAGGSPVTSRLQASSLIVAAIFTYTDADGNTGIPVGDASQVEIKLEYDSMINRGSGTRAVEFSASLRNKE